MIRKRLNDIWMVRIDQGEEIMEQLMLLCTGENITLAQVDAIGAADHAEIGVYDLEERQYHREELDGFMEITGLSGSVTAMNGEPYIHLHATLVDQNHTVHGGHVLKMRVGATCEMFVRVMDGTVSRKRDEQLGINLWEMRADDQPDCPDKRDHA